MFQIAYKFTRDLHLSSTCLLSIINIAAVTKLADNVKSIVLNVRKSQIEGCSPLI